MFETVTITFYHTFVFLAASCVIVSHFLESRPDASGARSQEVAETIIEAASQRSPPLLKSRNHPTPFTEIRISLYQAVLKQLHVLWQRKFSVFVVSASCGQHSIVDCLDHQPTRRVRGRIFSLSIKVHRTESSRSCEEMPVVPKSAGYESSVRNCAGAPGHRRVDGGSCPKTGHSNACTVKLPIRESRCRAPLFRDLGATPPTGHKPWESTGRPQGAQGSTRRRRQKCGDQGQLLTTQVRTSHGRALHGETLK